MNFSMNAGRHARTSRVSRACALVIAGLAAAPLHAQDADSDWQFAATIYGWFPDIGGHTEFASGAGSTIDVEIGTILDHLKMTAQGSFEVRKGKWGAFTDVVYLDVGEAGSTHPGHRDWRPANSGHRHGVGGFRLEVHVLDRRRELSGWRW